MGSAVDPTGLSFTVTKKDGTTASVSPQTLTPTTWGDTAGTQTCTFTYTDGYDSVSCEVEATVEEPVVVELDHIEISGDFTNNQIRGTAPDLTGLTVKAVYTDESEQTLTDSDYEVSPAVWPMGNPDNLAQARVTLSYTDGEVTKTAYKQPTLHYPTEQNLSANEAGHVYFDMNPEWYTTSITGQTGSAAIGAIENYFQGECQVGDIVALPFLADDYENDTPQTLASLTPYITALGGYVTSETGTPNTSNFVPEWNCKVRFENGEFITNQCYSAVSINGNAQTAQGFDIMYVIGKLTAVDTTNGYKKSDLDLEDGDFHGAEYLVHVTVNE